MSDFQTIADRVEIEALRGEFTDTAMMRDYDRLAEFDLFENTYTPLTSAGPSQSFTQDKACFARPAFGGSSPRAQRQSCSSPTSSGRIHRAAQGS